MREKKPPKPMNCLITAGPSFEPLDEVRRLTNFSTGMLGCNLADYLAAQGHTVKLLLGHYSTYKDVKGAVEVDIFTTSDDLAARLGGLQGEIHAIFHAAAVSDFKFGKVFVRNGDILEERKEGKFSTRGESLLAELVPTAKILPKLRIIFPRAAIFGWKYEVEGGRESVLRKSKQQLTECSTDAAIANGPAYGMGFGLVQTRKQEHFSSREKLFSALERVALKKLA